MNMNRKGISQAAVITVSLVFTLMIMGFLGSSDSNIDGQQIELKYEGTYGLYVQKTDHYNFRWITSLEDIGRFEVLDESKKIIATGETSSARTHSIDLDKRIEGPFTFKIGGKNTEMHEPAHKADF